jgi:hypothetical protein
MLPDGSYRSVLIASRITGRKRDVLIAAARRGGALEEDQARYVRVIEYDVPDREGDGKTGNAQLKTCLRGPGRVLRSGSPDLIEQEIRGCLLTRYALSALICAAASAGIGPDRVKFKRTVRVSRRAVGPAFPPEQARAALARVMADITRNKNLNPGRRHRTCPRAIKRGRHNAYRVKRPGDKNMRHDGPATIRLANPVKPQAAA